MGEREGGPVSLRATRQKRLLAEFLQKSDRFQSAAEIHAALTSEGQGIGLATVYKQLGQLAAAGQLDVLRAEEGLLYRSCRTSDHHHHVVCRECGRSIEVEAADVERWTNAVAKESGYTEVTHTIEIMGTCSTCTQARGRRAGSF